MKLLKIDSYHPLHKSFMEDSKVSEQGVLYITFVHIYVCVSVLGFLTTLLLSLPQLASMQRATVNVGTQVDVPVAEESTGREYIYHTEQLHVYTHICV